jgi:hypothetical protein
VGAKVDIVDSMRRFCACNVASCFGRGMFCGTVEVLGLEWAFLPFSGLKKLKKKNVTK